MAHFTEMADEGNKQVVADLFGDDSDDDNAPAASSVVDTGEKDGNSNTTTTTTTTTTKEANETSGNGNDGNEDNGDESGDKEQSKANTDAVMADLGFDSSSDEDEGGSTNKAGKEGSGDEEEGSGSGKEEGRKSKSSVSKGKEPKKTRSSSDERDLDAEELGEEDDLDVEKQGGEEEEEEESVPVPRTTQYLENLILPRPSSDSMLSYSTLATSLGIDTRAFDPEHYVKEPLKTEVRDEITGETNVVLRKDAIIRWRRAIPGDRKSKPESNARFVRWSDGSMTLHVGAKQTFTVSTTPQAPGHFLGVRTPGLPVQFQGHMESRMGFTPAGSSRVRDSSVMAMNLKFAADKTAKVKRYIGTEDPELEHEHRVAVADRQLRNKAAASSAQRRKSERPELTTSYLEDFDEGGEGGNIGAIKRAFSAEKRRNRSRRSHGDVYEEGDDFSGGEDDGGDYGEDERAAKRSRHG